MNMLRPFPIAILILRSSRREEREEEGRWTHGGGRKERYGKRKEGCRSNGKTDVRGPENVRLPEWMPGTGRCNKTQKTVVFLENAETDS